MVIRTSLVAAFAFVVAAAANAAESVHLYIKTSGQGHIQGSSVAKGKEKWIEIQGWDWDVKSPRDAASGLATGRRTHKPVRFTMQYDRAGMQLLQALVSNENVVECRVVVTQDDGSSKTATFSDIQFGHVTVLKNAETGRPVEEVSFNYTKIEWK
jgi:type VI secretion system secreted protein Hcp